MNDHVVTICHNNDKDLAEWQLYSIHQHLEPCNVHVVINEDDISKVRYQLLPVIKKMNRHIVRIWSRHEVLNYHINKNGWWHQQLIKLFMPIKTTEYVVLDCKDIFIKPTTIEDIKKENCKNQPDLLKCKTWKAFFIDANKIMEKHFKSYINHKRIKGIQTPRVIRNEVRKNIEVIFGSKKKVMDWFCSFQIASEFILYDTVKLHMNLPDNERYHDRFAIGIWNQYDWDTYKFMNVTKDTHIIKIHRRVYNVQENRNEIYPWLNDRVNKYIE